MPSFFAFSSNLSRLRLSRKSCFENTEAEEQILVISLLGFFGRASSGKGLYEVRLPRYIGSLLEQALSKTSNRLAKASFTMRLSFSRSVGLYLGLFLGLLPLQVLC